MDSHKSPKPKRKIKDTVFTDLFGMHKYLRQLYLVLHPEDSAISEDDLKICTLNNILSDQMYNDLGFLARDKLMILVEAQSTWNPWMVLRQFFYAASELNDYIKANNINIYSTSTSTTPIPKPELYMLFTGNRKGIPEVLSLSKEFYEGKPCDIEVKVHVLRGTKAGSDIVSQYVGFTRVYEEQLAQYGRTKKAIEETIRICLDKNILREYLTERQKEVIDMATLLFDQDYADTMRYHEAEQKGRAEGIDVVFKAKDMLTRGESPETISEITGLTVKQVLALR